MDSTFADEASAFPGPYEVRWGWRPNAVVTIVIQSLVGTASLVAGGTQHLFRLLVLGALILLTAVANVLSATRNRLAIRADERGLTLVKPALWSRRAGDLVDWREVRTIVIRRMPGRIHVLQVGVVRRHAGIPVTSFTAAGTPKPDLAVAVPASGFDIARLAGTIRAYAPDATIMDSRSGRRPSPDGAPLTRRARITIGAGVAAILAVIVTVAFMQSPDSGRGYSVQAGPAGNPVILTLPPQIGSRSVIGDSGPSALFKYEPELLPSGPTSSYGTVSGSYASLDRGEPDIEVDGVYAVGSGGGEAEFSLSPGELAGQVASELFQGKAQQYPTPSGGNAVLECWTYGDSPLCAWVGRSSMVFVGYADVPGGLDELAALTPSFVSALTTGAR